MRYLINKFLKRIGLKLIVLQKNEKPLKKNEKQNVENVLNGEVYSPFDQVPFAGETLQYVIKNYEFEDVLDVGSGEGKHSDIFKLFNKNVTSIDFGKSVYFEKRSSKHACVFGDYYSYNFNKKFDLIWASHVLEHQPNPNLFLKKIFNDLKENGILAITAPPLKHEIVGGHVTLWNAGLLLYQLVLAGFNCKEASIKSYGYNISVVLQKKTIKELPELSYDSGDITLLSDYLPKGLNEPFDGNIHHLNWK
ncbi:MAG: class I SAM-dependent methyltransferase [Flavobacteriales bacterium]|nr:class I SAM-dependent methyltransferase [Flavobacteriales bacterium]